MAALPYIQLYVSDYLADTAHLSTVEHGAYLLLIFNYWQRGESFSAKDKQSLNKRLASVARLSSDEWAEVSETLEEFFEVNDMEWRHPRIERDLEAVNDKSIKRKAAGKASAKKRSNKSSANAEQTLNHTDTDTDTEYNSPSESVGAPAPTPVTSTEDRIPYTQILDLYNQTLGGHLPRCLGLNDKHRKGIRACYNLRLNGGFPFREHGLEFWRSLFNDVLACPFMLGHNGRNWRASFEFLTTATKVQSFLEGKYDSAA